MYVTIAVTIIPTALLYSTDVHAMIQVCAGKLLTKYTVDRFKSNSIGNRLRRFTGRQTNCYDPTIHRHISQVLLLDSDIK